MEDGQFIFNLFIDYGAHIFVFVVLGFGSLIYYLSIKAPEPIYESPKLSKKKPKKEKTVLIKNPPNPPKIPETKVTVNIFKETVKDIVIEKEILDDNSNINWLPVVKNKKSKSVKSIKPVVVTPTQKNNDCDKIQPILIEAIVEEKPKISVIENVCDKIPLESLKIVKTLDVIEQPKLTDIVSLDESVVESRNISESPTHSLSDDFEIIDVYKTSSEDGLKIEIESLVEDNTVEISSTSGASRKKNKKQQKLISKQLIEAATIEEHKTSLSTAMPKQIPTILPAKKKRPRKDV